jgi:membrane fusion protein, multidrug efflux system
MMRTVHSPSMPLLLLLLSACSGKGTSPTPAPIQVGVVQLEASTVTVAVELTGRTAATMLSEVRPQVDGVIKARLFKEGSVVRAGEPLYQIDPAPYQVALDGAMAQLESAQATLASTQAKADRYDKLTDIEAVSRQDIDDTRASARQAHASVHQSTATLENARINLNYTRVVAPISGRIGRSTVTPGALVTANQTSALATIQQLDPMYVDVTQSSQQLLQLRRGLANGTVLPASAEVRLKLEDGEAYAHAGTIEFAEVMVDENTGMVTLRAQFPNPDGLLLPGMFVRVETPQSTVKNAILAPQQGITRDAKGGATALLVGADNKVSLLSVTAAQAIGDKWLITSGLKTGDSLIVEGTGKVRAGDTVAPVSVAAAGNR